MLGRALFTAVAALALLPAAALAAEADEQVDWVAKLEETVAELREAGIPVTFEEALANRPAIPGEENSALLLLQAFDMMEEAEAGFPEDVGDSLPPAPLGMRRAETVRSVVAAWLQGYIQASALIHYAAERPSGRYPLKLEDNPMAILMPHLSQVRRAARLMGAEAVLCAENRDPAGAADALFTVRRLAASIGDNVTLISALVRMAVDRLFLEDCERVLGLWPLKAEDLEKLSDEIGRELGELSLTNALTTERTLGYWFFDAPLDEALEAMGVHEGALEHTWRWLQYSPGSQWRARDLYHYFQLMGQVVALTRLPPRQRLREGARVEQAMEEAPEGFYITRLITPAIGRCVTTEVETRAALQVARTALAVERWRVENGAWPASLDDLVPEMLPEVPEDPFSEGILGYARLADGVCVYSLGKDGWEGGILRDEPRTEPYQGWDITFRLLDPKLRGATETELTDEVDADGQTLLHLAARLGDLELVRRLLDEGADVNAVDNEGRTPTGRAVEGGHEDVAELLRERGGVE